MCHIQKLAFENWSYTFSVHRTMLLLSPSSIEPPIELNHDFTKVSKNPDFVFCEQPTCNESWFMSRMDRGQMSNTVTAFQWIQIAQMLGVNEICRDKEHLKKWCQLALQMLQFQLIPAMAASHLTVRNSPRYAPTSVYHHMNFANNTVLPYPVAGIRWIKLGPSIWTVVTWRSSC